MSNWYYFKLFIKKTLRFLLKPLSFVPAALVMVMIFNFSAQDGVSSSALSTEITETIVHSFNYRMNMGWTPYEQAALVESLEYIVRKLAHFGEYALLGLALAIPLYTYGVRQWKLPLLAESICVAYAFLDEYHQMFSAGRSPRLTDVAIDSAGAITGILIAQILCFILARTIFRPLAIKKKKKKKAE